jgi:hypothetical protein
LRLQALIGWWITDLAAIRGKPQAVLSVANKLDRAEAIFGFIAPILVEKFGAKAANAMGRKSVKMPDGSTWEVRAATPNLHGGSYDLIVIDELWNISALWLMKRYALVRSLEPIRCCLCGQRLAMSQAPP